jgi:hypothetical protein
VLARVQVRRTFTCFFSDFLQLLSRADLLALVNLNDATIEVLEEQSVSHDLTVLDSVDLDKVEVSVLSEFVLLHAHFTQNDAVLVSVSLQDPLQVLEGDLAIVWHEEILVSAGQASVQIEDAPLFVDEDHVAIEAVPREHRD